MEKKNRKKKEKSVLVSGISNCAKSAAGTAAAVALAAFALSKSADPASGFFLAALICSGIGGFLCALFSRMSNKDDVLLCSVVSGALLAALSCACSLMFDNTGKELLPRIAPIAVMLISSLLFGFIFKGAKRKKRRSLR